MADGESIHGIQKQRKENLQQKEKQKHKLVDKAIPSIASAIKTVIGASKNEDFKAKCLNLFKVRDKDEFNGAITKRLWNIATSKLNVKAHDDSESQIVPGIKATEDRAEEATQKTNLCEKPSKSCFDDLAGEILFYEDQYCKENYFDDCKIIKTRSNTSNHDKDSSFDMLAEVQSNLSEEDNQTGIYVPYSKVHKLTKQGLPYYARHPTDRCNAPPIITETVPGTASPRAKLECQEIGVAPTGKITNSGDWLEEFSQDLFWIAADNKGQENERSEPSPKSLKDKDCCYRQKNQHN